MVSALGIRFSYPYPSLPLPSPRPEPELWRGRLFYIFPKFLAVFFDLFYSMKSLALGWCSLRAVLRRGLCGGAGRRWGVGCALGLVCVVCVGGRPYFST